MVAQTQTDLLRNGIETPASAIENGLRVTQMLHEHLPGVVAIERRAYSYPWSQRVFSDCLTAGYSCHLLWCDDRLVGYSLVAIAVGEAHLLNICIDPDCQGKGYASRFLSTVMSIAAQLGAHRVFLEVRPSNGAGLALYRKFNFARIGLRKRYYRAADGREDAVVLARDLSSHGLD